MNRNSVRIIDGTVTLVDKDGDPTLSPAEYFAGEYKKQKPFFYSPEGTGGSGEQSKTGGASGADKKSFNEAKTTDEKVEAVRQKRLAQGKEA